MTPFLFYRNKKAWTEEQEDELRQLYMENQANPSTEQGIYYLLARINGFKNVFNGSIYFFHLFFRRYRLDVG